MENFDWTQFILKITVNAPIQQLYDAWAKPSAIETWFLRDATYTEGGNSTDKNNLIEKGHLYAWQWFGYDVTEHGKITEANGKDFFQFTFAGDCLVDVNLTESKDGTLLTLRQHNIPTDEKSKRDYRLGCHTGWSFFLVNLKSVCEGGLDLRNKNNELKGMINS
jgi:uncharacterized protein YndB with AHSA1/START domain